jgi:hypothetical protein
MNVYEKIRDFCRKFRIIFGLIAIAIAVLFSPWWYLGIIPLIAGLSDFCPICIISKKCDLPKNRKEA